MKYSILPILFFFVTLTSCVDEDFSGSCMDDTELPEVFKNDYSLSMMVTLDNMGGTRNSFVDDYGYNPMEEVENYINPEKFRVLFFNDKDQFLFESKSRWVKRLDTSEDHNTWFVSVPIFSYGNDEEYDWDWTKIKEALTSSTFKIAILANRPDLQYFAGTKDGDLPADWFDNSGPDWRRGDTSWGTPEGTPAKTVFDLHHCQTDPIYMNKGIPKNWGSHEGFYNFIMGEGDRTVVVDGTDNKPLTMGATSCWVDYWNWNNLEDTNGGAIQDKDRKRYFVLPNKDKSPIPMYGIQEFKPITNWVKGTPFNLSQITEYTGDYDHRSISLLRSVVKLELVLPREPSLVCIMYPNIYARCEPMDVWTPTDKIWKDDHENDCEWQYIMNYGPIETKDNSRPANPSSADNMTENEKNSHFNYYRKKLSWFYGAWLDDKPGTPADQKGKNPWWTFGTLGTNGVVKEGQTTPYPRIFNTCIQRNTYARCEQVKVDYRDDKYHYVVYTGERNINDPSDLRRQSYQGTVVYWVFCFKNESKYYLVPFTDYSIGDNPAIEKMLNKPLDARPYSAETNSNAYMDHFRDNAITNPKHYPWPLIRNHVYRITIGNKNKTRSGGDSGGLSIQSENLYSKSINFDKPRKIEKETEKKKIEKE